MASAPTDAQREEAGRHLISEVRSILILRYLLKRASIDRRFVENEWLGDVANGLFEALLTHCRCLIEFLVGRPRRDGQRGRFPSDISPPWFVATWSDPVGAHPLDTWLQYIDRHAAHLSVERALHSEQTGREKPLIDVDELIDLLVVELLRFAEAVDESLAPFAPHLRAMVLYQQEHSGPLP